MKTIKDCPFCGQEAAMKTMNGTVYISCINPKCYVHPMTEMYWDVQKALRDWNTRKEETKCEGFTS